MRFSERMLRFAPVPVLVMLVTACRARTETPPPALDAAPAQRAAEETVEDAGTPDAERAAPASGGALVCKGVVVAPVLAELGCPVELPDDRPAGFSADGRHLGGCVSSCDPCPLECTFDGSPRLQFAMGDGPGEPEAFQIESLKLPEEEIEKRLEAFHERARRAFHKQLDALKLQPTAQGAQLAAPFPYPDLVLVQKAEHDDKTDVGTLSVGARVGNEEPVYPIRITMPPHPTRAELAKQPALAAEPAALRAEQESVVMETPHVQFVNLSRDGKQLGVVAFAGGALWFEAVRSARIGTTDFASRVYNDTGMRVLARDPAAAVPFFEKAAAALPTSSLFPYNLACAHARAGHPEAEAALRTAIAKGGAHVKTRAKVDPDLASVRALPWFTALVR